MGMKARRYINQGQENVRQGHCSSIVPASAKSRAMVALPKRLITRK